MKDYNHAMVIAVSNILIIGDNEVSVTCDIEELKIGREGLNGCIKVVKENNNTVKEAILNDARDAVTRKIWRLNNGKSKSPACDDKIKLAFANLA